MASRESALIDITPEVLLKAYSCGIFPMAESADDPALYWIEPERRGIIPLDRFHVPDRLARTVRSDRFTVVADRDFEAVINGCSEPGPGRARTWINTRIRNLYRRLYERGDCHTVEVYEGDQLVGGLYGVSLGRAFFGESMFHRSRDASKVALVHLVARLKAGHYRLLDTQFVSRICACSVRPKSRAPPITSFSMRRWSAKEILAPWHSIGRFRAAPLSHGLPALKLDLSALSFAPRVRERPAVEAAHFVGERRPDACATVCAVVAWEQLPAWAAWPAERLSSAMETNNPSTKRRKSDARRRAGRDSPRTSSPKRSALPRPVASPLPLQRMHPCSSPRSADACSRPAS